MDMFDDDDTLMYEPALTAAVIMTGDDEEAEKAALEVWTLSAAAFAMQPLKLLALRRVAVAFRLTCELHLFYVMRICKP